MNRPTSNHVQLVLKVADPYGEVRVDLDAFLKFNLRMDGELESLVARWGTDWTSPNPNTIRRRKMPG
ncbi:MAG: hypothetical protein O3C60_11400 [Planctomycetota bacterium]|nr:hypothetical protein [Planctomycetota bacterium]